METMALKERNHSGYAGAVPDRLVASLGACLALVLAGSQVRAQPGCTCEERRPFGSCRIAATQGYPGDFPGSAAVVARAGEPAWLFVADLFTGFTYRYQARQLDAGATALISPRGSAVTAGVAYDSDTDVLYWALELEVEEEANGTTTVRRVPKLVVTEVPSPGATTFTDVLDGDGEPMEFEVDLGRLARDLFGEGRSAGRLGGITYLPGRRRLWAADYVNDVYFELRMDGRISRDGSDVPVHFRHPLQAPGGAGAFGNTIAHAATPAGAFFDIPMGSLLDGRPASVLRVAAPASPDTLGEAGRDTGIQYAILGLLDAATAADAFPTGIAFLADSCGAGQSSEYHLVFDTALARHTVLEVSADEPAVAGVADLRCRAIPGPGVELTWRTTFGYDSLRIERRRLNRPEEAAVDVFPPEGVTVDVATDPETFVDVTLPLPPDEPDGTYQYRVITRAGAEIAPAITCTVTVGRGRRVRTAVFQVAGATRPEEPFALARARDFLYAADSTGGVARRYALPRVSRDGDEVTVGELRLAAETPTVAGPFAGIGRTVGLAYNTADRQLYWLGLVSSQYFLQSTDLEGSNIGTRQRLAFPADELRSPDLRELSWDAAGRRFWVVDARNEAIFAVDAAGRYREGSVIRHAGMDLLGGISVAEDDDGDGRDELVLDLTAAAATGTLLHRIQYERAAAATRETEYRLDLSHATGAGALGGVQAASFDLGGGASRELQFVAGTDSSLLYVLDLEPARFAGLPFRRGDATNDAQLNLSDPSLILGYLFRGGQVPECLDAADTNDDGQVNVADPILVFNHLFKGQVDPVLGVFECVLDTTPDAVAEGDLGCEASLCAE